jgi:hypothetical protein
MTSLHDKKEAALNWATDLWLALKRRSRYDQARIAAVGIYGIAILGTFALLQHQPPTLNVSVSRVELPLSSRTIIWIANQGSERLENLSVNIQTKRGSELETWTTTIPILEKKGRRQVTASHLQNISGRMLHEDFFPSTITVLSGASVLHEEIPRPQKDSK